MVDTHLEDEKKLYLLQEALYALGSFFMSTTMSSHRSYNPGVSNGFWGPVDASVDWCEPNYVVTYYIAEFYNTMSAIPMIFWALAGAILCWKYGVKELRYLLSLVSLSFIGIGSILFHGTLRYHAQLLDELPMVINTFCTFYCALDTYHVKPRKHIQALVIACALLSIVAYVLLEWFLIFFLVFTGSVVIQVSLAFQHVRQHYQSLPSLLLLYVMVVALLSVSGLVWMIENALCERVQRLNLHALWHVGGGYGLYVWNLLLIHIRGHYLKKQSRLRYSSDILMHYVQWNDV